MMFASAINSELKAVSRSRRRADFAELEDLVACSSARLIATSPPPGSVTRYTEPKLPDPIRRWSSNPFVATYSVSSVKFSTTP
jgi:hypothetical protein